MGVRPPFFDKMVHLVPVRGSRICNVFTCAVGKANCIEAPRTQLFYIARSILDIDVGANLILVFHEAEIPVREAMMIEPLYCLLDCHRVKMM
jgi:hypothetical protein